MRVGIIGAGVLGGQLVSWYQLKRDNTICIYDPPKGMHDDLSGCELVFICVPTEGSTDGDLSMSLVMEAAARVGALPERTCVVIRSTVMPGTTRSLAKEYPQHQWVFLPEFLTERTAEDDFLHPDNYVVGEDPPFQGPYYAHPLLLGLPHAIAPYRYTKYTFCSTYSAEVVKLASNAFYATKLSFMNQLYDALPVLLDEDKEDMATSVFEALGKLPMVGSQHTRIHQDGYRGFGGKCLPKDSRALLSYAERLGADMSLLRDAIEYNDRLRSSR